MNGKRYDVAIIGGGHNGLTCAAYLARAGLDVIVLEKNELAGGAAVTEEFHPGFRNSVAAYTVSLLNPKVIADLELARHGLRIVERPVANFWPVDERRYLLMPYGLAKRQRAIAAFSQRDAERLPAYDAALERAAAVLRDLVLKTPPNAGGGIVELIRGGCLGRRLLGLSLDDQRAAARPLHQERRRLPVAVVRERRGQGRVRLRRHRRRLRRAAHAGHGLRAAAPLLRRGERQARRLGPCRRRHGRHHARHGADRPRRGAPSSGPAPRSRAC